MQRLLALLCCVCALVLTQATTLRKLVGGMPKDDPLHIKALQHGDSLIDVTVGHLGVVRGLRTELIDKWLGIPYALPPIGANRWKKPTVLRSWAAPANAVHAPTHVRSGRMDYTGLGGEPMNATSFFPSCYSVITGGSWIRSEPESEDCLALNVWAPRGHVERVAAGLAKPLPVVVYLHGGGFILGSGSNPSTAPPPDTFVSSSEVIFVTLNYRLGPFSFISSAAMEGFGGMLGIYDQVAAMQWVKDYIPAFGGDPDQITLMGESAGSISICVHLVLPESRGLFNKAIMESALCGFPFEGPASARDTMLRLADALQCKVDPADPKMAPAVREKMKSVKPLQRPSVNFIDPDAHHESTQKLNPLPQTLTSRLVDRVKTLAGKAADFVKQAMAEPQIKPEEVPETPPSSPGVLSVLGSWVAGMFTHKPEGDVNTDLNPSVHAWGRFQDMQTRRDTHQQYQLPALSKEEIAADHLMMECMREKSAEEIRSALQVRRGFMFYTGESFFPAINGIDLIDHPIRLIERGQWAKDVELLYGHNKDEASIFLLFAYPFMMTEQLVYDFLYTLLPEHATQLWQHYVADDNSTTPLRSKVLKMLNDMWACSAHFFAAQVANHGGKIRYFHFQHEPSYLSSILKWLGSFHGVELDFVFGVHQSGNAAPTAEEIHLSREIMRLWSEFITGNRKILLPDNRDGRSWMIADADTAIFPTEGLPTVDYFHVEDWPYYDNVTQTCLQLRTHPLELASECRVGVCRLWEATMQDGLMRLPPQTPEPYISVVANVWGPKAVQWLSNYLSVVIPVFAGLLLLVLWKLSIAVWRCCRAIFGSKGVETHHGVITLRPALAQHLKKDHKYSNAKLVEDSPNDTRTGLRRRRGSSATMNAVAALHGSW